MKIELPNWIKFWFIITSIICTMDAMFILLRPHTLKGGSLEFLFVPCNIYIYILIINNK